MGNLEGLLQLPLAVLERVHRNFVGVEDNDVRRATVNDRDVEYRVFLRPKLYLADQQNGGFPERRSWFDARHGDDLDGGLIGALLYAGDPDIALKILR